MTSRREFSKLLALGGYAALHGGPAHALAALAAAPPVPEKAGETYWADLKSRFLIPREVAVLNAANLCPAPASVVEAVVNARDLEHDLSPANRQRLLDLREETRGLLADFLRVSPEEILITRNTSDSNNLVSNGLDLAEGDEVILFADNHPSNKSAWLQKGKRFGWQVRVLEQPNPHPGADYYVSSFVKAVTPKTRLLCFTHLTATVGDLMPAQELCKAARERGVLTLVDGAQSFGLIDVDLRALQADFYSGSSHKWVCGPKEAGVLFVRREAQKRLSAAVVSAYPGAVGISKTHEGMGQRDDTSIVGFGEAIRFQSRLGRPAIEKRARELARVLNQGLRKIDGVRVWTSPDPERSHAVVSFDPAGREPHALQQMLYEKDKIVCAIRAGTDRPGLRFSPHLYNTEAEVERAIAAVRRVVQAGA